MKKEYELLLKVCLINKEQEEMEYISTLLTSKLDWCEISGQIINHRLGGYFYFGLSKEQRILIPKEIRKALELLIMAQKMQAQSRMKIITDINRAFTEKGIHFAMLKGAVFFADLYTIPGTRRSNDVDILVLEDDLQSLDHVLREMGYIQSYYTNGMLVEASKKEKLIQRMNYHDLVPYMKQIESEIMEIDINFLFDNKENLIDAKIFEYGTQEYYYDGYSITGLPFYLNLAHLCTHFYREGTNTLWTNGKRDVVIYKLIDIMNTVRKHKEELCVEEWCKLMKGFNLQNKCYYTFFMLSQFYQDDVIEKIKQRLHPTDDNFIYEIKVDGENKIIRRDRSFFEDAFDCNR